MKPIYIASTWRCLAV